MQAAFTPVAAAIIYIVGMALLIGAFAARKVRIYPIAKPAWYQTMWARILFLVVVSMIGLNFIVSQSGVLSDMKRPAPIHNSAPMHGRGR